MKKNIKAGYIPLAKGSWLTESLDRRRSESLKALSQMEGVEIIDCGRIIYGENDAAEVYEMFAREGVELVIAHFLTFTLGAIIPHMAARLGNPVIFWSEPEPPMEGGRIETNSFCAANMNAHALWKMRLKYDFVHGRAPEAIEKIQRKISAAGCVDYLRKARIGSAGGRVPGFYTSNSDELGIKAKFGAGVEKITLLELVKSAETSGQDEVEKMRDLLTRGCDCKNLSAEELQKGAALLAAFIRLAEKYRLNAWAVRCWPELNDIYGIGVCSILGALTGKGIPSSCEGDVYGALAMLAAEYLTRQPSFFCDFISFDPEGDTGTFWHCGAAPPGLCREGFSPSMGKHSVIDGGNVKGISNNFPLKPGPVTLIRIGEGRERNDFRILTISGDGLETEQVIKGNPLEVRFNRKAGDITGKIIENGFEHHYAMAMGDISEEMKLFAKLLDLEIMQL